MIDLLRPVKETVKQTPLWPILRPRRIHMYGVGAPKTGTVSLAQLFGNYRTAHEAHVSENEAPKVSEICPRDLHRHAGIVRAARLYDVVNRIIKIRRVTG